MSQITSSAASAGGVPPAASPPQQAPAEAAARFEGMLFAAALKPLSDSLGVLGDELSNAVATAVARNSHDEFFRQLETLAGSGADDPSK